APSDARSASRAIRPTRSSWASYKRGPCGAAPSRCSSCGAPSPYSWCDGGRRPTGCPRRPAPTTPQLLSVPRQTRAIPIAPPTVRQAYNTLTKISLLDFLSRTQYPDCTLNCPGNHWTGQYGYSTGTTQAVLQGGIGARGNERDAVRPDAGREPVPCLQGLGWSRERTARGRDRRLHRGM